MTMFGKYQVIELVGEGGFGKVYRGQDPVLKRPVAIKTCTLRQGDMRERFAREAEIAANLRHPNILTVYDFGEQDGEPYLVQEFLPGEDMDVKIRRADLIPLNTKIDWLKQVAQGLRFAHENGVVHRDVKPSNIRILPDGQVRIMDFGIAKLLQADRQLTQMGFSVGTTGYLAPEQLRGEEIDHRADIFSFGVLAYELITYRRPFEGETVTAVLYRIANVDAPPLGEVAPSCPPRLARCIERCLRKRPGERWASLALVADELDAVTREIGAIGDAAIAVGPTRAFEVVTGSGRARPEAEAQPQADPAAAPPSASAPQPASAPQSAADPAPAAGRPGHTGGGGRRFRPVLAAFALVTLVIAIIGIVNVVRWGTPSPLSAEDERREEQTLDDAAGNISPGGIDAADRAAASQQAGGAQAASGDSAAGGTGPLPDAGVAGVPAATRGDGGAPRTPAEGDAGRTPPAAGAAGTADAGGAGTVRPDAGGAERAGSTGSTGSARTDAPAPTGAAALPASSILVLIGGGPEPARGVAESSLIAELLNEGFAPIEDETSAQMAQRIAEIRGLGQRHAAGTVVFGDLTASATPGVGRFFTGSATLTVRAYDANTGRLLGTRSFQVGGGGVPGKSAATEEAAVGDAARAVAYQASRFVMTLIPRD
jgi:predicted Ser/Thr protein kinase